MIFLDRNKLVVPKHVLFLTRQIHWSQAKKLKEKGMVEAQSSAVYVGDVGCKMPYTAVHCLQLSVSQ